VQKYLYRYNEFASRKKVDLPTVVVDGGARVKTQCSGHMQSAAGFRQRPTCYRSSHGSMNRDTTASNVSSRISQLLVLPHTQCSVLVIVLPVKGLEHLVCQQYPALQMPKSQTEARYQTALSKSSKPRYFAPRGILKPWNESVVSNRPRPPLC
jgi:hypothetical protein